MYGLVLAGVVALGAYLAVRAFWHEPGALRLARIDLPIEGLSPAFDGFTLAHITDLHLRRGERITRQLLEVLRWVRPDAVAVTGDLLDDREGVAQLARLLAVLARMSPVYAVLGDNDYEEVLPLGHLLGVLERAGCRVLRNQADVVWRDGAALAILGVEDPHTRRADLLAAAADRERRLRAAGGAGGGRLQHVPTVLLAHSPEIAPEAAEAGIDVVLAGHTHGGQICLPWFGALVTNSRLGRRFASGLCTADKTRVYVNRGIGTARLPARLFCPPEVAVIRLRRAGAPGA